MMKTPKIMVFGGCHVKGYPIGFDHAFPNLLVNMIGGEISMNRANVPFTRVPAQLEAIREAKPTHAIFQLGNYEFSASGFFLLQQIKKAFNIGKPSDSSRTAPAAENDGASNNSYGSTISGTKDIDTPPSPNAISHFFRISGLVIATIFLWIFSTQHRRNFRLINECMRDMPDTVFIFMAPFPCLDPAADTMRHLGGHLMRRFLAKEANYSWLDTYRLLHADPKYFVDLSHLNQLAHRTLAYALAAICTRHAKQIHPQTSQLVAVQHAESK